MNAIVSLKNGKNIGSIKGDVFTKPVRKSKHLFRKYNGWAIDKDILIELKDSDVKTIRIKDKDEKVIYKISLEDFIDKGLEVNYSSSQVVCEVNYFTKENWREK